MKIEWKSCFKIAVTVFILYLAIHFFSPAVAFLGRLIGAMSPVIIGACIAYIINIVMSFYEKYYFPHKTQSSLIAKTRRPICLILSIFSLLGVIALVCLLVLPELASCVKTLVSVVPPFITNALESAESIDWLPQQLIQALEAIDWKETINKVVSFVSTGMGDVVTFVTGAIASIFSFLVTLLFSVIFSIYLLTGRDRLKKNALRVMSAYLPRRTLARLLHLLSVFNDCFHRFIVGQCIEALILGALCSLGMMALRIPYATMIGALIAFTALIPIAGAYIGASVGAFMILTVSPMKALIFLIFLIILQQLEGNLIYPRVVGSSLGLPGIWVLFAVTIGGGLFGVAGMLIGVPLAAALYRLAKEALAKREIAVKHKDALAAAAKNNSEECCQED